MANVVQLKRSSISGRIPDAANVEVGEPVVNLADQKLYTKDGSGLVKIIGSGLLSGLSDVSNTTPTNNQVLTFDSALGKWKPREVTLESAISSGYAVDTFSGDGTSNTFVLSREPYNVNSLLVTIQGVKQRPGTDYSVSGNVISFVEAPYNTDSIDIVHLGSGTSGVSSVNGQVGNVTITLAGVIAEGFSIDKFTGDGTSNTFVLSRDPFNINSLLVTIQGVKQRPGTDYTLSGNVLSFVDAPYDTDIIDVLHLGSGVSGVSSINGLEGNVSLTTGNINESSNLYFTNTRARAAISVIGSGSYDSSTGVITVTGGVTSVGGATGAVSNSQIATSVSTSGLLTTANVSELNNLYYTDSRVYSNVSQIGYATNVNVALKANISDLTTANVTELTNLYYTDERTYSNVTQIGYATNANVTLKANVVDLNTSNVTEGSNLYYTDERTYSNVTQIGYATNANVTLKANVVDLNTSNVVEGSNLYFTNARSRAAISVAGQATYDPATGVINVNTSVFPTGDYGDLTQILDAFGVSTAVDYDCNAPGTIVEIDFEALA